MSARPEYLLPARSSPVAARARVFPSRYHVGLVAVLGAVFLVALAPKLDTDLWWHLKDGATIAARHVVPTRDYLSFTAAGHPWTDHEWLSDLFLYGCYRLAGLWGTIVAFALIICATFALVYRRMELTGANRLLCLFVLAAAFVASSSTWGARPQMITLLFLAVFCLTLDRWLASRDRRLLAVFPLVTLLWTNLHGGWILGVVVLVITLAGESVNRATRRSDALSRRDLKALALTIALTIAATLVNPAGLHEVLYPLAWILPSPWSNVLTEWVSSDFHQPVTMVFEAMLLLLIAAGLIARPRLNWTHLFLILVFTHLALSQSRNVAVWAIVISPLLARYGQEAIAVLFPGEQRGSGSFSLRPRTESLMNVALLLATCTLYAAEAFHFVNPQGLKRDEVSQFPAGAVSYMSTHRLPSRTFAAYAWGGYLLWRLYPHYRDFIDGRANTLFADGVLRDYLTASTAAPGWRSVLDGYRIGSVLIPPGLPLAQALHEDHGWSEAYHDGTAVLYVRR